jgi:hypothetical protein
MIGLEHPQADVARALFLPFAARAPGALLCPVIPNPFLIFQTTLFHEAAVPKVIQLRRCFHPGLNQILLPSNPLVHLSDRSIDRHTQIADLVSSQVQLEVLSHKNLLQTPSSSLPKMT